MVFPWSSAYFQDVMFFLTSPKPRRARRLLETVLISKMSCFFDLAEAPQGAPLTRNRACFQEVVFFLTSPKPRRARRLLETVLISNNPYNPYNLICHEAAPEQRYRTFDKWVLREISLRIFGLLGEFGLIPRQFSTFPKSSGNHSPTLSHQNQAASMRPKSKISIFQKLEIYTWLYEPGPLGHLYIYIYIYMAVSH